MRAMDYSKKEIFFVSLAVIVDALIVAFIYRKISYIGTDGAVYATLGKNIAEGKGLTLYGIPHTIFSPLLPYFIALFYLVFKNIELSAHLATVFFGLASLPLFYVLTKELTSQKIAYIALSLYAASGYLLINYAYVPSAQISAALLAILTFLALFKISHLKEELSRADWFWLFVSGLAIGLSYLARPEYIALIIPVLIYIFFIYRKQFSLKKIFAILMIMLIGFLLAALPYLIFLKSTLGYWTISGRGSEMLLINSGQKTDIIQNNIIPTANSTMLEPAKIEGSSLAIFFGNFKHFIEEYIKSLLDLQIGLMNLWGFIGMFFLALGIREFILRKRWRELWIFIISASPLLAVALRMAEIKQSYLAQFFYLFISLIAVGVWLFAVELKALLNLSNFKFKMLLSFFVFILCFWLISPLLIQYIFEPEYNNPREFKIMGLWAKENLSGMANETVLARKPDVSFYSDAKWQRIFAGVDTSNVVSLMKENNYKYLAIDNRFMPEDRPGLVPLLDVKNAPVELKFIKETDFYQYKVLLYSLNY